MELAPIIAKDATDAASATHRAYLQLRQMIVVGQLKPGQKLKIDDLKALLNTGASPIREALSLLTSDQLVERIDQRGFRTAPTSQKNFAEILGLRCVLEDMALRSSIANATEAWEERLVLWHHRMVRARSEDPDDFEVQHKAFHLALLENCDSPILRRYCSQLYDLNVRYRYLAGKTLAYRTRNVDQEHVEILQAAVNRDADLACARLVSHYRQTGAFLGQESQQPAA